MKEEELTNLIGRYYDGLTTPEEEKHLREYFASNSPAGFEAEKEIFSYYKNALEIPEPSDGLEARIIDSIDAIEGIRGSNRLRSYINPLLGIAASLIIISGLWFFFQNRSESDDTYDDPAIAYAETMKLLYSVSVQLNKGASALEPVGKLNDVTERGIDVISKSSGKIEKNMTLLTNSFKNAGLHLNKNNKE